MYFISIRCSLIKWKNFQSSDKIDAYLNKKYGLKEFFKWSKKNSNHLAGL